MTSVVVPGFCPLHAAHAIEQVVVSIGFEGPLASDVVRLGTEALGQFQSTLPGNQDLLGIGLHIGPGGMLPNLPAPSVEGKSRFVVDGAGVMLKELRLDKNSLVFRSQAYTRWNDLWGEAWSYFKPILCAMSAAEIGSFGLHYTDVFKWAGDLSEFGCSSLLKENSPYIAPRIFQCRDLWHCHSGQFLRMNEAVQRLEVVDLDCVDEDRDNGSGVQVNSRVVRISTFIGDRFNREGYSKTSLSAKESVQVFEERFDDLHKQIKNVFSEIISEKYAKLVGLNNA